MKNKVNNVPEYAKDYPVWVVTDCDGDLWFYGAYAQNELYKAQEVAQDLDMIVICD